MTVHYVAVSWHRPDMSHRALDQHSDDLMVALMDEPALIDPDVGVHFTSCRIEACTSVEAPSSDVAQRLALLAVQTALRRAGGGAGEIKAQAFQRSLHDVRNADWEDPGAVRNEVRCSYEADHGSETAQPPS